MNKRDNNLDLLRIVAAIMVIVQHVSAIYIHRLDNNLDGYYETANIYFSISVYAVPIFVMLSGAFLLSNSQNSDYVYFYRKIRRKIIKPTIIWSLLYVLFVQLKNYIAFRSDVEVDFYQPIKNLLNGRPYYHLWYLFMIIGLYAVTPVLIMIKDEISQKKFHILGISLLVLGVIINLEKFNPIWYVPIMTMVTLILSLIFSIIFYKIKNLKSREIISRGEKI